MESRARWSLEDLPRGLCVCVIDEKLSDEAQDWLIGRICSPLHVVGSAIFIQKVYTNRGKKKVVLLLMQLTDERLLQEAEMCQLRRRTLNNEMKRFKIKNIDEFTGLEEVSGRTDLLSIGEKQRLLLSYLKNMRIVQDDLDTASKFSDLQAIAQSVPGENLWLKLTFSGIVEDCFPLHSNELHSLEKQWCSRLDLKQPYDLIRDYYGEKIAMYFAFLGFYTKALIYPSVAAAFYCLMPWNAVTKEAMFALFNLIWVTVFLEMWKRRSNVLAYNWGMLGYVPYEPSRPEFKGPLRRSIVTQRPEPHYPSWKRLLRMFTVTYPLVFLCLLGATLIMLAYYYVQVRVEVHYRKFNFLFGYVVLYLPTTLYALVVIILSKYYRTFAKWLNEMENHRLQSSYENHLIAKLILFDFVNNFSCLFYVAFVTAETDRLFSYLACVLITQQLAQQFQESLLPYCLLKLRGDLQSKKASAEDLSCDSDPANTQLDELISLARQQYRMDVYEDTFDDYQELWCQFGYVFLFSAVFPLAAVFALLNNFIEIRSDAFKLCHACRRPFGVPAATIGAWQRAFEVLGVIAVMTNSAFLCQSAQSRGYLSDWSVPGIILFFVAFEHFILLLKFAIMVCIPDMPETVKRQIERQEYLAREAAFEKQSDGGRLLKMKKSATFDPSV